MLGLSKMNVSQVGRGPQVQQPPPSNRYSIKIKHVAYKIWLISCARPSFVIALLGEVRLGNDCTVIVLMYLLICAT